MIVKVDCDNIPAGQSPLFRPPKPLIAISHLRPGVFHISLQTHKTQHTQLSRVGEKNKQS